MAISHRIIKPKKRLKQLSDNYNPDEKAYDKGDDFHDAQGFRKRTFEGPERLTKEIRTIAQKVLGTRGFAGLDIIESWIDIVGEHIANGIRPEKLTFEKDSRTNGTLHVKSAGGAYAVLFEHQKPLIIEKINTFFGYPAVSKIHIMQGKLHFPPLQETPIQRKPLPRELKLLKEKTDCIADEDLRQKTYQIGLTLLKKEKKQ
ncbi:MAG: DUF721 domain-containing protein [Alphaproteobacteria bacterium]|nr:DUF721 domain-containing protein [Alphaproteobacteria bacterium]